MSPREAERREKSILAGIKKEIDSLRALLRKSRLDGAREGIEKLHALFGDYVTAQGTPRAAKPTAAVTPAPAGDWSREIESLRSEARENNQKLFAAIEALRAGQSEAAAQKAATKVSADAHPAVTPEEGAAASTWAVVAGRRRKAAVLKPEAAQTAVSAPVPKRQRTRPAAILVDVKSAEDFPALVQKLRKDVDRESKNKRVVGMRKARNGKLLIEVRGDAAQVEEVRAQVAVSAGPAVAVKTTVRNASLEVRDLDEWTTKEEVLDAVAAASGAALDSIKVASLRAHFGGTQTAVVSTPVATAGKLVAEGRLRVGLVSCRLRVLEDRQRCFKCLAFGHTASSCTGPDRASLCWSCGSGGHKAADCDGSAEARKAFAKKLAGKEGEPKP